MPRQSDPDPSGVVLRPGDYPMVKRKPPPEPDVPEPLSVPPWKRVPWKKVAPFAATAVVAGALGWVISPSGDSGDAVAAAKKQHEQKVAGIQNELSTTKEALTKEQMQVAELKKEHEALKPKLDEAKKLEQKLAAVVGKSGEVTSADGAVKLELVDKILFPTGEADLTANGREVLTKIGAAMKELDDKQIWVQGHTDDQPIIVPKAKPAPKGKKGKKPPPPPPPPVRFASNWELSAARALTVVHHLQDKVKIDPRRLAAVAFGEFRPASKNRAKNRRIEIVLYPRHQVVPK